MNLYLFLYPLLLIIDGTLFIYWVKIYSLTKNINYLIGSIIGVNLLIYLIYKMFVLNYSLLIVNICIKIIPTILLTLLNFIVLKDTVSIYKLIGIFLVIIGLFFLN